jgi:alcohol dehydrogenase YqhD (iron-dependent ADH family)
MQGNFSYHNPTKLYFGPDALLSLKEELKNFGQTVLFNYGGGSIKRNGIYDKVMAVLKEAGKTVVENPGVMSNPTLEKLREGVELARKNNVDFILAVGGGSVCDYSKAVAAAQNFKGDYWDAFFLKQQDPPAQQAIAPVGCVLTMAGTGSEMNGGSVITDAEHTFKVGHVFDDRLMPKFSILNPEFTFTVPENQMKAGIYDIMNHIMEQYFSGDDDNTSDYIAEGLMRGIVVAARKAVKNPKDYEARSNIMWTATWALNTLIGCGKKQDWMVHMFGHSIGAWTHCPHGYSLAAVSMAYYHHVMKYGLKKFRRFAENVWNIASQGKKDEQVAQEGLDALKAWMVEIGLPLTLREVGATEEMIPGIAKGVIITDSGYHKLAEEEVLQILHAAY